MDDLAHTELHQSEGVPPQPPLGDRPTIHPWASIQKSTFSPWTAIGPRTSVVETAMGACSYVVNGCNIMRLLNNIHPLIPIVLIAALLVAAISTLF